MDEMMISTADVWRPTFKAGQVETYTRILQNVPCNIQPLNSAEQLFYQQRGLENDHVIFTTQVENYQREDVFVYTDTFGVERQFHVLGVKNTLFMNLFMELDAHEWPEEAKKRLDYQEYTE